MNASIKWLKEYVDFDLSPEALAERLLMLGMEIESIKQLGEGLDRVVVGRINTVDMLMSDRVQTRKSSVVPRMRVKG